MQQYVIYKYPEDFPRSYVVRVWRMVYGNQFTPDDDYQLAENLNQARELIPEGMYQLDRSESDDPFIVEVWI